MRWLIVLVLGAGCDVIFGLDAPATEPGLQQRVVTVTPPTSTILADFPVSIVMTDEHLAEHASPDGSDIHFTDLDGNELPYEIVHYQEGTLEAWVRVTLAGATELHLAYGGASQPVNRAQMWSELYAASWHFAETGNRVDDSTSHDHHVSAPSRVQEPAVVEGVVGGARNFFDSEDDAMRQRLCAAEVDRIDFGTTSFSYSAWIDAAPLVGTFSQAFDGGGVTAGLSGFAIELSDTRWAANLSDEVAHVEIDFMASPYGIWTHLAVVVDRFAGRVRTYVDGRKTNDEAILTITGNVYNARPLCFGGADGYAGAVDEARIYTGALEREWIDAEYDNIANRASFVAIAPPD